MSNTLAQNFQSTNDFEDENMSLESRNNLHIRQALLEDSMRMNTFKES
jgi:hypothetical protein